MTQDSEYQPLYCVWAQRKFPDVRGKIEKVRFDLYCHGPLSDVTPDCDVAVEISLLVNNKWIGREAHDVSSVIEELLNLKP